jgi:dTDP-4-amino-4,6-dideoxygalactose transaminase
MKKKIYLCSPHMGGGEMKYIQEAFDSNWIAPLGPNVDGFEKELCTAVGAKHIAALSSGTAAIHLSLILLGVKPGDFVIGTSFTFSATVNPIAYLGATPVLVDSEAETWNMDPALLERAIVETITMTERGSEGARGRLKAIVMAHLYGMPARMREIMAIADKYGIWERELAVRESSGYFPSTETRSSPPAEAGR